MKHLLLAAGCLTLLCLPACTPGEEMETVCSDIPVDFSATLADTRAATGELTSANLASMTVFAYATGTTTYDGSSSFVSNYMDDQKMTRNTAVAGSGWTYSPKKYWPLNANEKISFRAFAPCREDIESNGDKLDYTNNCFTNNTAKTDFLLSKVVLNCTNQTGAVAFQMGHALTKVSFKVRTTRTGATLKVTSIAPKGYKQGTYDVLQGTFSSVYGSTVATYSRSSLNVSVPNGSAALIETFFMIPNNKDLTFDVTYTDNATGTPVAKTITGKYSDSSVAWKAGGNVVYELVISDEDVVVTAKELPDWGVGDVTPDYSGYNVVISSAEDLSKFRDRVNNGETTLKAIQTCDIDMSSITKWKSIGNSSSKPYTGTYNGDGHLIKGINFEIDYSDFGLFRYVGEGGLLVGINLRDVYMVCYDESQRIDDLGTLVGRCKGNVSYCSATGEIDCRAATTSMDTYIGGLVGRNISGTITRSTAKVDIMRVGVSDFGGYFGGLVGDNEANVAACIAMGDILIDVFGEEVRAGGFCGINSGSIYGCYARGDVNVNRRETNTISYDTFVGGFIGEMTKGIVRSCYSYAGRINVSSPANIDSYGGGFIGVLDTPDNSSSVEYSCSDYDLNGMANFEGKSGGFVGWYKSTRNYVRNCYAHQYGDAFGDNVPNSSVEKLTSTAAVFRAICPQGNTISSSIDLPFTEYNPLTGRYGIQIANARWKAVDFWAEPQSNSEWRYPEVIMYKENK